jgi:hypothetical protein
MTKKVGITWNFSGVYVWGLSESEILQFMGPILQEKFPKLQIETTSTNFAVKRMSKLSGQDAVVGETIYKNLVASGWIPCLSPELEDDDDSMSSSYPVWGWGKWVKKS